MPWVRIDDQMPQHPKVAQVGPLGLVLQIAGLCYCNRYLTDGFIPWSVAQSLLTWEFLGEADSSGHKKKYTVAVTCGMSGDDVTADFVISLLLEAHIWEDTPGGYQIHDYLDYQPSKAQVLAEREQTAKRVQKFRNAGTNAPVTALHPRYNAVSNAAPNPNPNPKDPTPPLYSADEPEWYKTLSELPGFQAPFEHCKDWLARKGITEDHAEITAYALKGKWPPSKDSKDAWATFQNWVKRPPLPERMSTDGTQPRAGARFDNSDLKFLRASLDDMPRPSPPRRAEILAQIAEMEKTNATHPH